MGVVFIYQKEVAMRVSVTIAALVLFFIGLYAPTTEEQLLYPLLGVTQAAGWVIVEVYWRRNRRRSFGNPAHQTAVLVATIGCMLLLMALAVTPGFGFGRAVVAVFLALFMALGLNELQDYANGGGFKSVRQAFRMSGFRSQA